MLLTSMNLITCRFSLAPSFHERFRRFAVLTLALLFSMRVASPAPAIAEPDPSAIVAANYPHDLAAQLAKDGADSPENRQQAYVLIPASGADYIVAAYSNKIRGAVVLLQKTATGYTSAQIISSRLGD